MALGGLWCSKWAYIPNAWPSLSSVLSSKKEVLQPKNMKEHLTVCHSQHAVFKVVGSRKDNVKPLKVYISFPLTAKALWMRSHNMDNQQELCASPSFSSPQEPECPSLSTAVVHVFWTEQLLAQAGPHKHLCCHSQEQGTLQCWGRSKEQCSGRGRNATQGLGNLPALEPACFLLPCWRQHLSWRNDLFNCCLRSKWRWPLENWQLEK